MEHSAIIKSLVRVSLPTGGVAVRRQVERLVAALEKADDLDAAALRKLLTSVSRQVALTPSKLERSAVATPTQLMPGVAVPVDRESSVPIASLVFPTENAAGLPVLPQETMETIAHLLAEWSHREVLLAAGFDASLTCLLHGAPGTGKTTLAMWLAAQMGLPAVVAKLDGLISSFLGTTARNIGALFDFANRYDCVLVLDEFDAIAKLRDDPNEVGEIKRVVNTLLQNLDARARRGVTIGITNHESLLDPAVWRRFEVQLALPLPSFDRRLAIAYEAIGADEQRSELKARLIAAFTDGLSGAEVITAASRLRKQEILGVSSAESPAKARSAWEKPAGDAASCCNT